MAKPTTSRFMKEKTFQVVLFGDKESTFELRSASHWCEQCLLFVYDMMLKKVYSTTHNGDVQSLRQSSASGCHMCEMILDRCHPDQRDFYLQRTGKKDTALCMQIQSTQSSFKGQSLTFKKLHFGLDERDRASLSDADGTESVWHNQIARNWLSTCQRWHHRCTGQPISTIKPSRLLELSSSERQISLRLRSAQELTEIPLSYCTLSHCWGRRQPVRLTRGLLRSFQHHIPFETLPKTFADAIQITLNLGLSYLWIDSLCICQDDQDDWLAESAKMGDIYSNATCNIAALAAKDDHEGCYTMGPTLASSTLYFSTRGKRYMTSKLSDMESRDETFGKGPLGKRGWVFQELVLSPRTIYYGAGRILWDCITDEADEAQTMEARLCYTQTAPGYKSAFAHFRNTGTEPFSYSDESLRDSLWNRVVEQYTSTELTYESDRWLAVSGLATRYMERTGQTFVAGLRWDRLLEDMSWWSHSPAGKLSNGAPSWSWLSCRSGVGTRIVKPDELLATLVALPDKQMSNCTWHVMYEASDLPGQSTKPKCYPLKISGHVRSFRYVSQDGSVDGSFSMRFHTYSMEAADLWLDLPLESGMSIWGVAYSFDSPFDPRFEIILLAPASHGYDCWQRVGVCRAIAHGFRWDNRGDSEKFLQEFGPVKELTIV
jgi:hypothetical protein